jgi:hypothetical protein
MVFDVEGGTMEELLKLLGFTTPLIYATAAYAFFHWLDENTSDEAKATLARTMRFKDYKNEQVAAALVEVFDRIYTYPLLRWRAFRRSLLLTTAVSAIYLFEMAREDLTASGLIWIFPLIFIYATPFFLFNILSDYLSLFVIRPLLIRSATKPVIYLVLGAVSGVAIVLAFNSLRNVFEAVVDAFSPLRRKYPVPSPPLLYFIVPTSFATGGYAVPALAVFAWLPLFALGILAARLLTPLSWVVLRTQWFLKEGKEHPLKAIGYVAAVVIFIGTVAARAVFSA